MNLRIVKVLVLGALLAPMIGVGSGAGVLLFGISSAHADVTVYRGLQRKNATYAKVADSQFKIDSDGLSTFEAAEFALNATTRQCKLDFNIEGVTSQPAQDTQGVVTGMPSGYVGTYTPQHGGVGHWSIENLNGTTDAADFTTYALGGGLISVNADYTGSSPSQCQTPSSAN